ncbi:anti-sigma factor family protein [Mycobacterium antarcticum]|uniref:anti-sigma factor family protein n=1 Tax=Mycolicibacterium sp. TUM20984 TaxID=3023368 RepID=UPI00238D4AF5|nr:zf-HC2 domain-containing protein [Mycolicibacterium sp. TUM20984]GLP81371.1 hypothetical protein TUM20984_27910 [Mycolicibacterium sp. TUM20984]
MRRHHDISCRAVTELASAYGDTELNVAMATAVSDHVACCAGCRNYLAQVHATRTILRRMGHEPLEPRYRERLFAAFHRSE